MTRKIASLAAASAMVLASIASTAAWADTIPTPTAQGPSGDTVNAMQAQCDALAASYDTGNGDRVTGEVVPGTVTLVGGPTEVDGTRVVDENTIQHAGTYVPATLEIRGDPFRIGGSVNLFGDQWSTAGYWTDSTYNFTADFETTFRFDFNCTISREVFHPEVTITVPADGVYVVAGDFGESEAAIRGNCAAFTAQGYPIESRPSWWGEPFHGGSADNPHCRFEGTPAHEETTPAYYDPPVVVATLAGTPIDEVQTDSLYAFEDHGGPVQVTGEYHVGQVVVCISPSTGSKKGVPGEWRQQNGYTGDKCTTDWFQVAPWGAGTEGSNGTYISVPDYSL